jgi:dipeptidyl aminopeptidase/acylaminoacyl peptidase
MKNGTERRAVVPFGSWRSPISAEVVSAGGVRLDSPQVDGDDRYWLEGRPAEQGRVVLVRWSAGVVSDVTPPPFSVRTRVHEYGGGAYLACGGTVWFSHLADQRLWKVVPGSDPVAFSAAPGPGVVSVRYADARLSPDGRWLVCVRETHLGAAEVVNELVALRADTQDGAAEERVLAKGHDFYSFPRMSGGMIAWTCWDHPLMPWDGTELWVASLELGSDGPWLAGAQRVAGGPAESIIQPEWGPDGRLWYVSDAAGGWWNLWRHDLGSGECRPVTATVGEWGGPQWVFGSSTYAFVAHATLVGNLAGTLVGTWRAGGVDHLGVVDPVSGTVTELDLGWTAVSYVRAARGGVVLIGASASQAPSVVEIPLGGGEPVVLASSASVWLDPTWFAEPEAIEFPTSGGTGPGGTGLGGTGPGGTGPGGTGPGGTGTERRTAYGLYYPPTSPSSCGPEGELPPLVVMSHGGPTSATTSALNLAVQYWTSRGIAVVDVNYGGSTGYGRAYRERLAGAWGIVDVDDCVNAARYLVDRGDVDGGRLAIRGASAGGYTTLCALTFRDDFAVGASYYGVADAAALAADTHKFEARYLDSLIGPWPQAAAVYRERSPLFHTGQLCCPVILFQGCDDPIVPPSQAESMVAALAERGVRHAYLCFEGEAHGFRRAETLRQCLVAELDFYGEVLGFEPAVVHAVAPGAP